ncbi:Ig-like domain-containing protein, partial [Candidatus Woesearchaeota archaeon]|nr:Ig-like domain-containing protein [Candidatus Woesearchaeota archaeon]
MKHRTITGQLLIAVLFVLVFSTTALAATITPASPQDSDNLYCSHGSNPGIYTYKWTVSRIPGQTWLGQTLTNVLTQPQDIWTCSVYYGISLQDSKQVSITPDNPQGNAPDTYFQDIDFVQYSAGSTNYNRQGSGSARAYCIAGTNPVRGSYINHVENGALLQGCADGSWQTDCAGNGGRKIFSDGSTCASTGLHGQEIKCYASCIDIQNIADPTPASIAAVVDQVGPVLDINPAEGTSFGQDFTVAFTESDALSGLDASSCYYAVFDEGLNTLTHQPELRQCNSQKTITVGPQGDCRSNGRCFVLSSAKDNLGNGNQLAKYYAVTNQIITDMNALVQSNTFPDALEVCSSAPVSLTMKNTGAVTWTLQEQYRLGAVGDADPFTTALRHDLNSGESIVPGQTKRFDFTLTAPQLGGVYTTDWQMLQEGVAWFGDVFAKNIVVSDSQNPTSPVISSSSHPVLIPTPATTAVFTWTAGTDCSGIEGYSYALDALPDNNIDVNQPSIVRYPNLADGAHIFYVKAQDNNGRWSTLASYIINVDRRAGVPTKIVVDSITDPLTAGISSNVRVKVLDSNNNLVASYTGTIAFTTTDSHAAVQLPPIYTFTSQDRGQHTFQNGVVLATVGRQNVTATDAALSLSGYQEVQVRHGDVSSIASRVDAFPIIVRADGLDFSTVNVTLFDDYQNPIAGKTVTIHTTRGPLDVITPVSAITQSDGRAQFHISSTTVGLSGISATDLTDSIDLQDTAGVYFQLDNRTDPGLSTVTATSPHLANGIDASTVTVTLKNAQGQPLINHQVQIASSRGAQDTITPPATVTTNSNGIAVFYITSFDVGTATITATDASQGITLRQTPAIVFANDDAPSNINSTVDALPTTVRANGISFSRITVTLRNAQNQPLQSHRISISTSTPFSDQLTILNEMTDANGQAFFQIRSLTIHSTIISARDTSVGIDLTDTAQVDFVFDDIPDALSTVDAYPTRVIARAGSYSTITVTLKNRFGQPIPNHIVEPFSNRVIPFPYNDAFTPIRTATDSNGVAVFLMDSLTLGHATVSARDTTVGYTLQDTADVEFVKDDEASNLFSSITAQPGTVIANGIDFSTVTVTIRNPQNLPVPGKEIALVTTSPGSDQITIINNVTNSSGH